MFDFILSITVLCAFALLAGSFWIWRKQGATRHSILMAILAFVMLANVVIWVAPTEGDIAESSDTAVQREGQVSPPG